jgi:hypothetical protein
MPRPTTLPTLLASLPRATSTSTQPVLVRPASWPSTSYYKITRSTLKFRPVKDIAGSSTRVNPAKLVGGQNKADAAKDGDAGGKEGSEGGDMLEVGELKASGRVWGMLFWDGTSLIHDASALMEGSLGCVTVMEQAFNQPPGLFDLGTR